MRRANNTVVGWRHLPDCLFVLYDIAMDGRLAFVVFSCEIIMACCMFKSTGLSIEERSSRLYTWFHTTETVKWWLPLSLPLWMCVWHSGGGCQRSIYCYLSVGEGKYRQPAFGLYSGVRETVCCWLHYICARTMYSVLYVIRRTLFVGYRHVTAMPPSMRFPMQ